MQINNDECEAAGLDEKEVKRIARGLSRYAKQAQELGLTIFGGTGCGTLRFDDGEISALIIADIDGDFSGGDGAACEGEDGLLRAET